MKYYLSHVSIFTLLMVFAAACGPKQPERPWFTLKPPQDNAEYLYATSSFDSVNESIGERQAVLLATTNMALKLGSKVETLQKIFQEEVGNDDARMFSTAFELASRQIASQQVTGVSVREVAFQTLPDGKTRIYVLVQMPVGDARRQLTNALSRDEELYIRFKESRAFDELNSNLERIGGN
jgi:hypothetical protein